ncbi:hypothetical protein M3B46_10035 [Sphingobacterium daejeonense]|uniref:hypothetical protein n=1 Tax=Sphingobacterium daejeonense TaxID=371142 RepID=UPI0021A4EA3B|nr:hypothetical protein [Sphingobacterium daejeonense]MCT1531335.1 hypothetical protein [Sphingobacterium daejeonense]
MIQLDDRLNDLYKKSKSNKTKHYSSHVGLTLARQLHLNSEKAKLFLYLSIIEKSILSFRSSNINCANFFFNKISKFNYVFPDNISAGTLALKNALESYKEYILKNYFTAESLIRSAIKNSVIQSKLTQSFLSSAFEQWLNLARLLITTQEYDKLETELESYFMFLEGIPSPEHLIFNTDVLKLRQLVLTEAFIQHDFFIIETIYTRLDNVKKAKHITRSAAKVLQQSNLYFCFIAIIDGSADYFQMERSLLYYHLFSKKSKHIIDGLFSK